MKNQAINYKGEKVITTKFLANLLEVTPSLISSIVNENYKNNRILCDKKFDKLICETDYYDLQGKDRMSFVDNNRNAFLDICIRGGNFRIFTKAGVAKMSRNLRRLNLYHNRIYGYFSESDLTNWYQKYEKFFTEEKKKIKFVEMYKDNNYQKLELDQIRKSIDDLSAKVEVQRMESNFRLAALEERIDKILMSKFAI